VIVPKTEKKLLAEDNREGKRSKRNVTEENICGLLEGVFTILQVGDEGVDGVEGWRLGRQAP
jgi:hypothetical protein